MVELSASLWAVIAKPFMLIVNAAMVGRGVFAPFLLAKFVDHPKPHGVPMKLQETTAPRRLNHGKRCSAYNAHFLPALLLSLGVMLSGTWATSVQAAPLTFEFNGVVQDNGLSYLFPGKSIGDPYSGRFTVDPAATVLSSSPDAASYDGGFFDVTIEGISYGVTQFRVSNSSPPSGGVQFTFVTGGSGPAFLSLRSTSGLYANTNVPTSFDAADFDAQAYIGHTCSLGDYLEDMGPIDAISVDDAEPLTFNFSGHVGYNQLGTLFAGKSIGDAYSGSFTVDPNAAILNTSANAATYDGSTFDLTVEGVSHNVTEFRVWNSSPPGGGVQFSFDDGNGPGFLALRSTSDLYASTDVPTSFDITDFDSHARVQQLIDCDLLSAEGSIDEIKFIPEPLSIALLGIGALCMASRRRS